MTRFPILPTLLCGALAMVLSGCSSSDPEESSSDDSAAQSKEYTVHEIQVEPATSADILPMERLQRPQPSAELKKRSPETRGLAAFAVQQPQQLHQPQQEKYQELEPRQVKLVREDPVSTFALDVDTGGYSNVRRFLNNGQLPPKGAVRLEELINYFNYDFAGSTTTPASDDDFAVHFDLSRAPWDTERTLFSIGVKARELPMDEVPPVNLVFLIDTSGSMAQHNKLPLLQQAYRLLAKQLRAEDSVSIVTYAGSAGLVLEPTAGDQKTKILQAIDRLQAGGSTNGAGGIELAYAVAQQAFKKEGVNRILLATDGDFNVGISDVETLKQRIERGRKSGVQFSALGFGMGNYREEIVEQLTNVGDGSYAYIDTIFEANRVLVEQLSGTLFTIAKDAKVQVEFNPARVVEYRLLGYENRRLNREDFNNDAKDSGDIGAGHSVVALYELTLVGDTPRVDPLRYGDDKDGENVTTAKSNELATVKVRYKKPGEADSTLKQWPLAPQVKSFEDTQQDLQFATAVAGFGLLLRSEPLSDFDYEDVVALAQLARGKDVSGDRAEFVCLVKTAGALASAQATPVAVQPD
ncbi:VWA domain-containing protein [Microbulbifer sp. CAU 1566]|uniref:vWA domain-containing protein n=1 Tax=Microbulbifer sp. CAU 1566 TaxID=2933269 RepID=UPI002004733B|nr:VWA domain-containing protein [Microbulbifer sp. CAU 1566]MCK7598167.1 VWA domain-containing protein [Microbulbifer sp. CAU 1566]